MPLLYHYKDIQNDDENSGDTANTYLSPQQHNANEKRRVLAMESERQSAMKGSKKRKKQRLDSSADSEQSSTVATETMEVSNTESVGEATQDV